MGKNNASSPRYREASTGVSVSFRCPSLPVQLSFLPVDFFRPAVFLSLYFLQGIQGHLPKLPSGSTKGNGLRRRGRYLPRHHRFSGLFPYGFSAFGTAQPFHRHFHGLLCEGRQSKREPALLHSPALRRSLYRIGTLFLQLLCIPAETGALRALWRHRFGDYDFPLHGDPYGKDIRRSAEKLPPVFRKSGMFQRLRDSKTCASLYFTGASFHHAFGLLLCARCHTADFIYRRCGLCQKSHFPTVPGHGASPAPLPATGTRRFLLIQSLWNRFGDALPSAHWKRNSQPSDRLLP